MALALASEPLVKGEQKETNGSPASTVESITVPPAPELNFPDGASAKERDRIREEWQKARRAWAASLTDEQWKELQRRDAEKERKSQEEFQRESRLPIPDDHYNWRVMAKGQKLDEATIEQLQRDKISYGSPTKQSFDPYLSGPVFITSDSLLNGFHVLLAETVRQLELRESLALRPNLEAVLRQTRANLAESGYPSSATAPGWRHAQLAVGPAMVILGTPLDFFDREVRDEIAAQVAKIRAADSTELPGWLGPPSRQLVQIDYRRLEPVGFYASSERLADYFRAVRWLQMIPYRANRPVELGAIGLLGYGLNETRLSSAREYFRTYDEILGEASARDLSAASSEFQNFFRAREGTSWEQLLLRKQHWLARRTMSYEQLELQIDDRLRPDQDDFLSEVEFRVISPHETPDSRLLQTMANDGLEPSGLAIAAMLGSGFARDQFHTFTNSQFNAAIAECEKNEQADQEHHRSSFFADYLDVLRSLQLPAPKEAPKQFRSRAWAAKSCQTTLASWAQMRHTFTLQSTQSAYYLGMTIAPSGFVEPNPEFFSRMADLAERAMEIFETQGCFDFSPQLAAESVRENVSFLAGLHLDRSDADESMLSRLSAEDRQRYSAIVESAVGFAGMLDDGPDPSSSPEAFRSFHRKLLAKLIKTAEDYASGSLPEPEGKDINRERWNRLISVSRRLEALAHKQLRQVDWNNSEDRFLKKYGENLGFVMGYFGNSWLTPADDAPRWVEIHRNPQIGRSLAVGVGRARKIYVLYPWNGIEILCCGSVMPYYEYEADRRLTDKEWLRMLDSEAAPALPSWMSPYMKAAKYEPPHEH